VPEEPALAQLELGGQPPDRQAFETVDRGFLVLDNAHRFPEAIEYLSGLIAAGKLKYEETVVDGLDRARDALNQMFDGSNVGKLLVRIAEPREGP
jgi:NADPH-dependent curcumin reductase CurA